MFLDLCVCERQHSHGRAHTRYQLIRPDCQRSVFRFVKQTYKNMLHTQPPSCSRYGSPRRHTGLRPWQIIVLTRIGERGCQNQTIFIWFTDNLFLSASQGKQTVSGHHFLGLCGRLPAGHQQKPVERQTLSSQVWPQISVGLLPFPASSSVNQKGVSFKPEFHTLLAVRLVSASASPPATNSSSFLPNLGRLCFSFADFYL